MERGSTKHGQNRDDQMARETQGMTRGAAQRPHTEEWREPEPVEDSVPSPGREPADPDITDRSELARVMTRDLFPATRERLLRQLEDSDAPPHIAGRLATLTPGRRFGDVHEVLAALGIASPETREPSAGTRETNHGTTEGTPESTGRDSGETEGGQ
ncbi:MAG: DUF2795 domain-containing protein [Nocardiopsaceae bacterium]|nr:DUF2795 domain-containing protein [Nocardiopsaceae bacterium]